LLKKIGFAALPLVSCAREKEIKTTVQKLFSIILQM
jgi:hypothetical protein